MISMEFESLPATEHPGPYKSLLRKIQFRDRLIMLAYLAEEPVYRRTAFASQLAVLENRNPFGPQIEGMGRELQAAAKDLLHNVANESDNQTFLENVKRL